MSEEMRDLRLSFSDVTPGNVGQDNYPKVIIEYSTQTNAEEINEALMENLADFTYEVPEPNYKKWSVTFGSTKKDKVYDTIEVVNGDSNGAKLFDSDFKVHLASLATQFAEDKK